MSRNTSAGTPWALLRWVVVAVYLFALGPIIVTASVSFNAVNQSRFPPVGFSLRWWEAALVPRWLEPLLFSVQLSLGVALLTTLFGFPLAYGLTRYRFPGRDLLMALSLGPLALPAMVTGIGLLQLMQFAGLGFLFGLPALVIGHLVICLPFAVRTIGVSLQSIPRNAEQAALSLGARPFTVFREVTLPLVKNGVFAGASFAFVQSFTDYSISLFLARPGSQPITVTILSFLEFGFAPTLAAVAVLTMAVPMVLIGVVQRFFNVGEFIYENRH
jgi:putative spermidine/putrescine transport system permease protein